MYLFMVREQTEVDLLIGLRDTAGRFWDWDQGRFRAAEPGLDPPLRLFRDAPAAPAVIQPQPRTVGTTDRPPDWDYREIALPTGATLEPGHYELLIHRYVPRDVASANGEARAAEIAADPALKAQWSYLHQSLDVQVTAAGPHGAQPVAGRVCITVQP